MHEIMPKCQHGFTKGKSIESVPLEQKETILRNIEVGKPTLGIFVDYSKAYDSVFHDTVLTKLEQHSIRGVVHWFLQSCLLDRQQGIVVLRYPSANY